MLILSRKAGESIVIDGRIVVKIVRVEGDMIKLGIDAPSDVPVHRQEVYDEIQRNNQEALNQSRPKLPRLSPRDPSAKSSAPVASPAPAAAAAPLKPKAGFPAAKK
jgi:carbon storage regulator